VDSAVVNVAEASAVAVEVVVDAAVAVDATTATRRAILPASAPRDNPKEARAVLATRER
jgi:hypothetical protein